MTDETPKTSQIKTDSLVHNLVEKNRKTVDNALLNLGVDEGTVKPAVLTGSLVPAVTLRAELVIEIEIRYSDAVGALTAPTSTPSVKGTIRTLSSLSGQLRVPSLGVRLSGTVVDLDPIGVGGHITVPKTEPKLVGLLVWKASVFRGLEGTSKSRWKGGKLQKADFAITHGKGIPTRVHTEVPWGLTNKMTKFTASYFNKTLPVYVTGRAGYRPAVSLNTFVITSTARHALPVMIKVDGVFRPATPLNTFTFRSRYDKLIPLDRFIEGVYSKGVGLYSCLKSTYDLGAKQYKSWLMPWAKATPLSREGFDVTKPWKPPTKQPYQGSTTLNLRCRYRGRGDNYYLNLAVNRCYTKKSIDSRSVYIVLNEIMVDRYFDGQPIKPSSVSMSTDRDSWCWSFSMQVSADQAQHLKFPDDKLPLIRVILNNKLFIFLVESKKRSRGFGQTDFTYTGRSITALLDSPHASKRTHTQPGAMTSVQLVEEELARVPDANILLDWVDLVSSNGWLLPEGALSYSNLNPMEAIKEIVKPVGGAIVSDPALPMIHIKPRTPYGYWETPAIKMSIPEDIIQQDSSDWVGAQSANAVYVYSNSVSLGGRVIRQGTAGDVLAEQMSSRMYTDADSIREAGRSALIEANPKESTQYSTAMYEQLGVPELCEALEITSETGSFWGTVDSVGIDVRVNNEVTVIDMTVGIERFLPEGENII